MIQTAEIFQDRMMLQQKKEVKIWGKSGAGDVITAQIQGKTGRTTADNKGDWCVTLPELTASEQETLVLENGGERLEFHEVAVGEVWIAGGQSNMEFKMRYEKYVEEEKKNLVQNPNIRFFDVPQACFEGQRELMDYSRSGFWRMATPEDLDYFSAAGYYFQKELAENLNVPVGIIGCNWGGSTASVWMKKKAWNAWENRGWMIIWSRYPKEIWMHSGKTSAKTVRSGAGILLLIK